jgi:hypothetical protein
VEANVDEMKIDILPEAARKELKSFYEYLMYKYLKKVEVSKRSGREQNKHLAAFHQFKKYRDRINPVVDSSVDIDELINEANRDIF